MKALDAQTKDEPPGLTMANLSIGYGAILIIWGIAVSILAGPDSSLYIPSVFGWVFLFLNNDKCALSKKLWMHIAVVVGLVCAGRNRFFMVIGDGLNHASASILMLLSQDLSILIFAFNRSDMLGNLVQKMRVS